MLVALLSLPTLTFRPFSAVTPSRLDISFTPEPNITSYFDALWYIYSVTFTVGLGDIVVTTALGKICSVLISIYALFVTALATGVVVSFYNRCVEQQYKETREAILDKLSRLPELSKEELEAISDKVKNLK